MNTTEDKKPLRKLIDIPKEILVDLKKLAIDNDSSLKSYIEDILVNKVIGSRSERKSDLK